MSLAVLGFLFIIFQFLTRRENADCLGDGPIWKNREDGWCVHYFALHCNWQFLIFSGTGTLRISRKIHIHMTLCGWSQGGHGSCRLQVRNPGSKAHCCLSSVFCLTSLSFSLPLTYLYHYLSVLLSIFIFIYLTNVFSFRIRAVNS